MAKQSNQKLKLLYLLRILLENTDEQSGMTLSRISEELAKYSISAGRKSLYDDIEALRVFGIDVCVKRDRYVKYYIDRREFSFVELKYTIDALENFDSIDPEVARSLSEKVIRILGVKGRVYSQSLVSGEMKMPKVIVEEVEKNLDVISKAISSAQRISCKEFDWNSQKQRILKNDGKTLTLTPIRLVCDRRYILYAFDGTRVQEYRVDRLLDVELISKKAAPISAYKDFFNDNLAELDYANVRIEFDNLYAGEVFEHFGLGVTILSSRESSFEVSAKVKLDDAFYSWLFNNAKYIRKISPERVREEYKERILIALDNVEG